MISNGKILSSVDKMMNELITVTKLPPWKAQSQQVK